MWWTQGVRTGLGVAPSDSASLSLVPFFPVVQPDVIAFCFPSSNSAVPSAAQNARFCAKRTNKLLMNN